jgi:hypothetical protein
MATVFLKIFLTKFKNLIIIFQYVLKEAPRLINLKDVTPFNPPNVITPGGGQPDPRIRLKGRKGTGLIEIHPAPFK